MTSDKLSELACLTLYLMYEKKNGKQSVWYEFIKVRGSSPQECSSFFSMRHNIGILQCSDEFEFLG